jgi:catechol 2,3-dioxygenase-like lactoylglutathione lyase family enzyme
VFDQDEAKDFYVDKLGCEVAADMAMDGMRFLLVRAPEQPDVQLILSAPGPPIMDRETAEAVRTLVAKGSLGPGGFVTADCQATYQKLEANGVEFLEEPEERFYGTDAAFRDPFGNHWRLTQVKNMASG